MIARIKLVALGLACTLVSANVESENRGVSIFYKSLAEADADLARFEQSNPGCKLWTNWQKICSRVPNSTSAFCTNSHGYRARPSSPFCVNMAVPGISVTLSPKAMKSRKRFCRKFRSESLVDRAGKTLRTDRVCSEYHRSRPFSGRFLADRRHPLCARWKRHESGVWSCSEWADRSCAPIDGVPVTAVRSFNDGISVSQKFKPDLVPVFGVMCEVHPTEGRQ
jgi:hypothetical protein